MQVKALSCQSLRNVSRSKHRYGKVEEDQEYLFDGEEAAAVGQTYADKASRK